MVSVQADRVGRSQAGDRTGDPQLLRLISKNYFGKMVEGVDGRCLIMAFCILALI